MGWEPTEDQIVLVRTILHCDDDLSDLLRLGYPHSRCSSEVRRKFKQLALLLHPDKNKLRGAQQAFQAVKEAFEDCIKFFEALEPKPTPPVYNEYSQPPPPTSPASPDTSSAPNTAQESRSDSPPRSKREASPPPYKEQEKEDDSPKNHTTDTEPPPATEDCDDTHDKPTADEQDRDNNSDDNRHETSYYSDGGHGSRRHRSHSSRAASKANSYFFRCPYCDKKLRLPLDCAAGPNLHCLHCGGKFCWKQEVERQRLRKLGNTASDRLYTSGVQRMQEKRREFQANQAKKHAAEQQEQQRSCPFTPNVKTTRKGRRYSTMPLFERLYNEGKNKQRNQAEKTLRGDTSTTSSNRRAQSTHSTGVSGSGKTQPTTPTNKSSSFTSNHLNSNHTSSERTRTKRRERRAATQQAVADVETEFWYPPEEISAEELNAEVSSNGGCEEEGQQHQHQPQAQQQSSAATSPQKQQGTTTMHSMNNLGASSIGVDPTPSYVYTTAEAATAAGLAGHHPTTTGGGEVPHTTQHPQFVPHHFMAAAGQHSHRGPHLAYTTTPTAQAPSDAHAYTTTTSFAPPATAFQGSFNMGYRSFHPTVFETFAT